MHNERILVMAVPEEIVKGQGEHLQVGPRANDLSDQVSAISTFLLWGTTEESWGVAGCTYENVVRQ